MYNKLYLENPKWVLPAYYPNSHVWLMDDSNPVCWHSRSNYSKLGLYKTVGLYEIGITETSVLFDF